MYFPWVVLRGLSLCKEVTIYSALLLIFNIWYKISWYQNLSFVLLTPSCHNLVQSLPLLIQVAIGGQIFLDPQAHVQGHVPVTFDLFVGLFPPLPYSSHQPSCTPLLRFARDKFLCTPDIQIFWFVAVFGLCSVFKSFVYGFCCRSLLGDVPA